MHRHSLCARLLWLLFAALQLAGPQVVGWADAQLKAASSSPSAVPHVEDHSSSDCPHVHTADCAVCQFLTRPLAAPTRPPAIVPLSQRLPAPRPDIRDRGARATRPLPLSRAPPALV